MPNKVPVAGGPRGGGYVTHRNGRRVRARGYLASRGSHTRPDNAANPDVEEFNRQLQFGEVRGDQFEVGETVPLSPKQAILIAKAQSRVAKQESKAAKQSAYQAKLEAKFAKAEAKIASANAKRAKEATKLDRAERGVKLTLWGRLTGSGSEKPLRGTRGRVRIVRAE